MARPVQRGGDTSGIGRRRTRAQTAGADAYQQRRREIARAAVAIFDKKGFQRTSFGAVAAELGIDRASLYYYMGSKEELFDEAVRDVTDENVARAEAIQDSDSSPADKLRALITELMDSYATHYPLPYLYLRENLSVTPAGNSAWAAQMQSLNRRYEDAATAIIQQGLDESSFRAIGSARVLAFGVLGAVGWTSRWFAPDKSGESATEVGMAYVEMILNGVVSDPVKRPRKR